MHIGTLAKKSILILGYGKEGQSMAQALKTYAPDCNITIGDANAAVTIAPEAFALQAGKDWLTNLDTFEVIIKSPGIPPLSELLPYAGKCTSPTRIFLDSIASSGANVIGVTGSKGKSTTSSLIHAILKAAGKETLLVGNIGEPAINHLADAKKDMIFVMEMSSYQLMDLTVSPRIAVVTAFFPEHLDYHGSLLAYLEAKMHITRFQKKEDYVFYDGKNESCKRIAQESPGERIACTAKDAPVSIEETKLKGAHNLSNIGLAYQVARFLGVTKDIAKAAIIGFTPLPHRLQSLGIYNDIEWVNDSISTTPQSLIAALEALKGKVDTVILGGQDRGYDFSVLPIALKAAEVSHVILLPDSGRAIRKAIEESRIKISLQDAMTMQEAVAIAKTCTEKNSICLLSPASPSYGHFKNFEDRGEQFALYVRAA